VTAEVVHDDDGLVESRIVAVDGIPMSALIREVPQPRAVIVALHGGAASSVYFDYRPRMSLLQTGAALGFTVIALDRPGYGSSHPYAGHMTTTERRVDLAYAAVDRLLASRPRGAGVFLVAHSIGCELAVRMASDERGTALLGLEISGTGRHHHHRAAEIMDAWKRETSWPRRSGPRVRGLLWQPTRLYPPDLIGGASISSPAPAYEATIAETWPRDFPEVAARVRIPVQYTLGEHELVWRSGPEGLADIASLFTASPRVVVNEQAESGHNMSVGLGALAYHLKVLSFVEECVLAREVS
jgi:pimeloyl-ACP methyl ester carboxylesterase